MKKTLNIILIIIFTSTIFLVSFSMTILNTKFVRLELSIHDYYNNVLENINNEVDYNHVVNINDIKNDVNNYINGYYEDREYTNKIYVNDDNTSDELKNIYNKNVKFIKPMNNIKFYHDMFDITTIVFVILTGVIFLKTKGKHSLNMIVLISSIIGIIIAGVIFILNNYNGILYTIVRDSYYVYLGINVFLLLLPIYTRLLKKHKIICK